MLAVLSDIHINLKKHAEFETSRVLELAYAITSKGYKYVVLNGDLLDSARPTLQEIRLAQDFIDIIADSSKVYLLDGNHESINVHDKTSTYDYIRMHNCKYIKNAVLDFDDTRIRLTSWSHLKALTTKRDADILITHVRSDLPPHINAERDMEFLNDYALCILGDIHHKYSPKENSHYTNSPYAVNFSSSKPNGSYITVDLDTHEHVYIDLDLPQKIKLVGEPKDFKDFKPDDRHLYKIVVEGTLQELRTLKVFKNVIYTKIIKQVIPETEEIPETVELLELLTDKIVEVNEYTDELKTKTKKFIGGLIDEISS